MVQWTQTWAGAGADQQGDGIAMDRNGNIYIGGNSYDSGIYDSFLLKFGVDTDRDLLTDDQETYQYHTNTSNPDTDGDGLGDGVEIALQLNPLNGTDATIDFDGDGLSNSAEYWNGTDLFDPDTDGDGLSDGAEVLLHDTDPLNPDSDGDGFTDGTEVAAGTDPNNAASYPKNPISGFQWLLSLLVAGAVSWRWGRIRKSSRLTELRH